MIGDMKDLNVWFALNSWQWQGRLWFMSLLRGQWM